jgi:hypothetical protein
MGLLRPEAALPEMSKRQPVLKSRVAPAIEAAVVALAVEQPTWGQVRVANELRKSGHVISPAGVRCVWARHDLETTKKRLKALEAKVAQEGVILTEAQIAALEKAKADKEAHGEFESECPGLSWLRFHSARGTLSAPRSHRRPFQLPSGSESLI